MKHSKHTYTIVECDYCPVNAFKYLSADLKVVAAHAIDKGWKLQGSRHKPLIKRQFACPDCVKERGL